jgi:type VI secretion system secreted protein Hcp
MSKLSKEAIEIIRFDHRVERRASISAASNGGSAQGEAEFHDLRITKLVDKASPNLNLYSIIGDPVGNATLTVYEPKGTDTDPAPLYAIKLEKVFITSVQLEGNLEDVPEETVTLRYSGITWTEGKSNSAGWDLEKDEKK